MSSFAGIDYDSREIHVVEIDEDSERPVAFASYDLAAGPGDSFQRARRVRRLLAAPAAWTDRGVIAFGIEDVYTKLLSSLVAHKRIEGALLATLPTDLPIYPIRPQTWKQLALGAGKGNADKEGVRAWAMTQDEGLAFWTQGLIDAYAIAVATARMYETDKTVKGRQEGAA